MDALLSRGRAEVAKESGFVERSTPVLVLTALALTAFAANSLLCRMALSVDGVIDPLSFTTIRLLAGTVVLLPLAKRSAGTAVAQVGSWVSALALFGYAIAFSLAYVSLNTASGALILFGGVQITMLLAGILSGERPGWAQWCGLAVAASGLLYFLVPGATAPSLDGGLLMSVAGVAWGVYTQRGRGAAKPLAVTASNFARGVVPALVVSGLFWERANVTGRGVALAALSGAVTSGLGYVIWYRALRSHTATSAAVVQLVVPLLAAGGGVLVLGETPTLRLAVASALTLGGIAITLVAQRPKARGRSL
jgi:drug/metabolite transporter (DMT)-like permease